MNKETSPYIRDRRLPSKGRLIAIGILTAVTGGSGYGIYESSSITQNIYNQASDLSSALKNLHQAEIDINIDGYNSRITHQSVSHKNASSYLKSALGEIYSGNTELSQTVENQAVPLIHSITKPSILSPSQTNTDTSVINTVIQEVAPVAKHTKNEETGSSTAVTVLSIMSLTFGGLADLVTVSFTIGNLRRKRKTLGDKKGKKLDKLAAEQAFKELQEKAGFTKKDVALFPTLDSENNN